MSRQDWWDFCPTQKNISCIRSCGSGLPCCPQVIAVFSIAELLEKVIYGSVTLESVERTVLTLILVVVIRFFCERMGARSSYLACVDVKRILREKIYEKMLKLGCFLQRAGFLL